ncbi:hypothetical protein ATANTOWER_017089 [Ataeniobius toweri]|uniref:Uncharacterized protein n=1 Tax=Ataeniobius toweri TaxID=208326 RepID=A0ABU7CKA5_9TELE|nr:hypothetical protein [Ataeniobius toweri]
MNLHRWTCFPVSAVLMLVLVQIVVQARSASAGCSDRNSFEDATVNATVLDRGSVVHVMSSEDGTYGQNSLKMDVRGMVLTPAPHHGGSHITAPTGHMINLTLRTLTTNTFSRF